MNDIQLCGYLNKYSFYENENIKIYIHFRDNEYVNVNILDKYGVVILKKEKVKTISQKYKPYSFAEGCEWKETINIDINFDPGYYFLKIYAYKLKVRNVQYNMSQRPWLIPFIVKNRYSNNKILVLDNIFTREAYNAWASLDGLISLYKWKPKINNLNKNINKYTNFKKNWSNTVSFLRPNLNSLKLRAWNLDYDKISINNKVIPEVYGMKWLDDNNFKYDIINDIDLHENPDILKNYKVFMNFGHNEYWTKEMIEGLKSFILNEGNFINLGGNSLYWKATFKNNQLQVMKNNELHTHDNTIGGYWSCLDTYQLSVRVSDLLGAYLNKGIDQYNSYPYKISNLNHWIFKNISSEVIGNDNINRHTNPEYIGASGWEVDEICINKKYSLGTSFHIKNKKTNDIIYYINNGRLFNVGSVVFSGAMLIDKNISLMVLNVLNNFLYKNDNDTNYYYKYPKTFLNYKFKLVKKIKLDINSFTLFPKEYPFSVSKTDKSLKFICSNTIYNQGFCYKIEAEQNSFYQLIIKGYKSNTNFRVVPIIRDSITGDYIWRQNYYENCIYTSNIDLTTDGKKIKIIFKNNSKLFTIYVISFYNKINDFFEINSIELNQVC